MCTVKNIFDLYKIIMFVIKNKLFIFYLIYKIILKKVKMGNQACCQLKRSDYEYKYNDQSIKHFSLSKRKQQASIPNNISTYEANEESKYIRPSSRIFNENLTDMKKQSQYKAVKQTQNNKQKQKQTIKYDQSRYSIVNILTEKQSYQNHQKAILKQRQMQIEVHQSKQNNQKQIKIPTLSSHIMKRLNQKKFYQEKFDKNVEIKNFGGQIYQGYIDSNSKRPHGFGKMYKTDGSLFIGDFTNGVANGQGVIIFEDGSYLKGLFNNNTANGVGQFQANNFKYYGPFKYNLFHGKQAKQIGPDYQFQGEYIEGHKLLGKLKWKNQSTQYFYNGMFNQQNQFHGLGVLNQPDGQYSGYFKNGKRQGKGQYKFANGLTYKGEYLNNLKHGKGILYNNDNTIAYQGQFERGLPHGQGSSQENGKLIKKIWVQGIDSELL